MRKTATNTTIRNVTKQNRLTQEHVFPRHILKHSETTGFLASLLNIDASKEAILYNLGKKIVGENKNSLFRAFLNEYDLPPIPFEEVPDEFDLLGAAYQYLNSKYENLELGSFYTNQKLALSITKDFNFGPNDIVLDPACGSGVFLFAPDIAPENIYGVDYDPIAVMIAKFNFFIKFPNTSVAPNIQQADFLEWYSSNKDKKFSYILGNPPYGANLNLEKVRSDHIITGESFSYFIEYSYKLLSEGGILGYLLPEAILTVKRHMDIRDFIIDNAYLSKIQHYDTKFAGVMSDIYYLQLEKTTSLSKTTSFTVNNKTVFISQHDFKGLKNHVFAPLTKEDEDIINHVKSRSKTTLQGSTFGLGVVTGNNVEKLLSVKTDNTEPIFTGKEIEKYVFLPAKKHIVFDRNSLQQVAPDAIYRAEKKLVYKVISKRFKVVIDESQSLSSSSANIIVPNVKGNSVYSVALLLNSDLYSFLNQKLHGVTNKVSRGNLEALPLPVFSSSQLLEIEFLIKNKIRGAVQDSALQDYVYDYFEIPSEERVYITNHLE